MYLTRHMTLITKTWHNRCPITSYRRLITRTYITMCPQVYTFYGKQSLLNETTYAYTVDFLCVYIDKKLQTFVYINVIFVDYKLLM